MVALRVITLLLVVATPAMAANTRSTNLSANTELRLSLGFLEGESRELVYDADGSGSGIPGYKVSELFWKLNNVPMAVLGLSVNSGKSTRFNLNYSVNAADGNGTLDDYDWLYVGLDWSDWSHHPDTTVRKAEMIDVSGEYTISKERRRRERSYWSAVLGFRRDFFDWQAKGGTGIYSDVTYRDTAVAFPNVPGISYQQTFTAPYIGFHYKTINHSKKHKYETRFSILYSAWANGEDVDIHHLRDLKFEEKGSGGVWYKLGLEMYFDITKRMQFSIGYSGQVYNEIKAPTLVTDLTTGTTTYYPGDSAGLSHKSQLTSLGLSYRF